MEREISYSICQYAIFRRPLPNDFCIAYNEWQEFSGIILEDNYLIKYTKDLLLETIALRYDLLVISARLMGII